MMMMHTILQYALTVLIVWIIAVVPVGFIFWLAYGRPRHKPDTTEVHRDGFIESIWEIERKLSGLRDVERVINHLLARYGVVMHCPLLEHGEIGLNGARRCEEMTPGGRCHRVVGHGYSHRFDEAAGDYIDHDPKPTYGDSSTWIPIRCPNFVHDGQCSIDADKFHICKHRDGDPRDS